MDLLIVIDGIYLETPDGKIYSDAIYDTSFFKRYFSEFEHVYVIARVKKVSETPSKKSLLISKNITILPLPEFEGTIGYIKKHSEAMQQIKEYIHYADNIILRVPGMVSNDVFRICIKNKKRIILEVTSDPWMLLSPGTVYSPFRTIVRLYWTFFLKYECKKADAIIYVTQIYLQRKYSPNNKAVICGISDAEIMQCESMPKQLKNRGPYIICHVNTVFKSYGKGHLQLITALKKLRDKNIDVKLRFIGDGPLKKRFIQYAKKLDVIEYVDFLGKLPNSEAVREEIKFCDLFVLPTKTEGLPRTLIEAMSTGVPCISSPVGGIPEVLDANYLVNYNDVNGLVKCIEKLLGDKEQYLKASMISIECSKQFLSNKLNKKRNEFFKRIKQ